MAFGHIAQRAARVMRAGGTRDVAASASTACASTVLASTGTVVAAEQPSTPRSSIADRYTTDSEAAFRRIVARAAALFLPAGRSPYYFARGKLGGDPVFAALLRDGRITSGVRIVDIGCGLGLLPALLAAAEKSDPRSASEWPATWAPPPSRWTLHGFDLRKSVIAAAQCALSDLADRVSFTVDDVRNVSLPACDTVVMLDVLHYIDHDHQRTVLKNAYRALPPSGTLLMRVGNASADWRFRWTLAVDWWTTFARGSWPRFYFRPLAEWRSLLESIGFFVVAQPMSGGTAFANVLLIATRRKPAERD